MQESLLVKVANQVYNALESRQTFTRRINNNIPKNFSPKTQTKTQEMESYGAYLKLGHQSEDEVE
uniref:hypothetical protein n=1 Tax=Bartonella sp. CL25QHWL TaxID=3243518 RepID=UPI0035CF9BEF